MWSLRFMFHDLKYVNFSLHACYTPHPFHSLGFIALIIYFFPVALQSSKDQGRLTYRRFLEIFRHMVRLLGRVISPSQGLYLHRATQHRKTRTNIHAFSGIGTHDPSNQPAKTHASDRTATVTGNNIICSVQTVKLLIMHFLHPPVTSSLLGPNILLCTLFSSTFYVCLFRYAYNK
jgi:hypothetical protein